jgi:hypothetical protein
MSQALVCTNTPPAPTRPDDIANKCCATFVGAAWLGGVTNVAPQPDLQGAQLHITAAVNLAACLKLSIHASTLSAVTAQPWLY